jgi:hypothetical protein
MTTYVLEAATPSTDLDTVHNGIFWVPPLPGFSEVRVTWSLVFCVVFCTSLFVLCLFDHLSFDLRLLVTLWYVQTFLNNVILFLDFNTVIICQLSIMRRKFKQWWSLIPPISTKRTIASHLNWTHWTQIRPRHMMLESQALVLSVLRFKASDYPFGIIKLFLRV